MRNKADMENKTKDIFHNQSLFKLVFSLILALNLAIALVFAANVTAKAGDLIVDGNVNATDFYGSNFYDNGALLLSNYTRLTQTQIYEMGFTDYNDNNLTIDYPNLDTDSTDDLTTTTHSDNTIHNYYSHNNFTEDYGNLGGYKKENLTTDYPNIDQDGRDDLLNGTDASFKTLNVTNIEFSGVTIGNGDINISGDLNVSGDGYFGGKVGIGTDSPLEKLHVVGDAIINGTANLQEVLHIGTDGVINAIVGAGDNFIINIDSDDTSTANFFSISHDTTGYAAANELFRVQEDGKAGLGTAAPALDAGSADVFLEIEGATNPGLIIDNIGNGQWFVFVGSSGQLEFFESQSGSGNGVPFIIESGADTNSLYIESDNDVGIGTANPVRLLHLNSAAPVIQFTDTDTSTSWHIGGSADDFKITETDVATRLTILDGGRVGIGTASPAQLLEIEGTGATAMKIESTATAPGLAYILFSNTDSNLYFGKNDVDGASLMSQGLANATIINDDGEFGMQFGTSNSMAMTIDNTQNVGIGTASPGARLDVRGSAIFNEASGDNDFRIESDGNTHMIFVDAGNDRVGIGTASPNYELDVNGDINATNIYSFGNVGIGTVSPTSKLDIAGDMKMSGNITSTSTSFMINGAGDVIIKLG